MSEQDEVKWLQGLRVGDDRAFKVLFEKPARRAAARGRARRPE